MSAITGTNCNAWFSEKALFPKVISGFLPFRTLNLNPNFIEPPRERLTAEVRENRVRVGIDRIHRKLGQEWTFAEQQMESEVDRSFRYREDRSSCPVERTTVGDLEVGICHFTAFGDRHEMQNEHLATEFSVMVRGQIHSGKLFGIFGGHEGKQAAQFLKNHLKNKLEEKLEEFNLEALTDEGVWNALKLSFVELNREFDSAGGSTATVAMILDDKLWTANIGNARTILQNHEQILQLSQDARPDDPRFARSIENRGGEITIDDSDTHLVNRRIALGRTFGDRVYNGAISARPKITCFPLRGLRSRSILDYKSRLILASSKIYKVSSTREIGNAALYHEDTPCDKLAQNIAASAHFSGPEDNASTLVVDLK